ncbi:hypothetical protein [Sandaracinus amylolyticus]|uniref:Uncharacterized protein n=1 Tax=Sandaracinus amylolyticus TaxID=927083 RepID=A0A0F6SHA3_9BACT|nr:hypothetical protein [Sandaracinus amylolyticus]AKF10094.1 hypothetical protein DB32_007243 [Sandaracinus amylolyticus]
MSREAALRLGAVALVAGVLHVGLGGYACSDLELRKGEGEPCVRASECEVGLECIGGVCRAADAGPPRDAGSRDASAIDADVSDADVSDADVSDAASDDAESDDAESVDASDDAS